MCSLRTAGNLRKPTQCDGDRPGENMSKHVIGDGDRPGENLVLPSISGVAHPVAQSAVRQIRFLPTSRIASRIPCCATAAVTNPVTNPLFVISYQPGAVHKYFLIRRCGRNA